MSLDLRGPSAAGGEVTSGVEIPSGSRQPEGGRARCRGERSVSIESSALPASYSVALCGAGSLRSPLLLGRARSGPGLQWYGAAEDSRLLGIGLFWAVRPVPARHPPPPPATHPLPCPKARDWDAKPSEQGTKGGPGSGMSGLTLGGGTRDRPPRAGEASPAAESCAPTGSGPTRIGRGRKSQMSG